MEVLMLPSFINWRREGTIFDRLEIFTNLCRKITYRWNNGEDCTVKYMTELIEINPTREIFAINELMDLLKECVFNIHGVLVKDGNTATSNSKDIKDRKPPKFYMFDDKELHALSKKTSAFNVAIIRHQNKIEDVRRALKTLLSEAKKFKTTESKIQESKNKLMTEAEGVANERSVTRIEGAMYFYKINRQTRRLQSQKELLTKVQEDFEKACKTASELKTEKLDHLQATLKEEIESAIARTVKEGIRHLKDINCFDKLDEKLRTRINTMDFADIAKNVYKSLTIDYTFPNLEQLDVVGLAEVPACRLTKPNLDLVDTINLRLQDTDCFDFILSETTDKVENRYVLAIEDVTPAVKSGMKLCKGAKLKQKLCSQDAMTGFGWQKRGLRKTYGFYPTFATSLAV